MVKDTAHYTNIINRGRSQGFFSFRLGHSIHPENNKPWKRRNIKPFLPRDKEEASKVLNWILHIAGLPPLKFTLKLLETKQKGGEPCE
jgi:hypothetical protein